MLHNAKHGTALIPDVANLAIEGSMSHLLVSVGSTLRFNLAIIPQLDRRNVPFEIGLPTTIVFRKMLDFDEN